MLEVQGSPGRFWPGLDENDEPDDSTSVARLSQKKVTNEILRIFGRREERRHEVVFTATSAAATKSTGKKAQYFWAALFSFEGVDLEASRFAHLL